MRLPAQEIGTILLATANFDMFDGNNDHYDTHDCALLYVGERQLL